VGEDTTILTVSLLGFEYEGKSSGGVESVVCSGVTAILSTESSTSEDRSDDIILMLMSYVVCCLMFCLRECDA
jgi:hypothetical protein